MRNAVLLAGICLCLVMLLSSAQVTAQQGIVQIDQVSSLVSPYVIKAGENARFLLRFNNNTGRKVDISNGFRLHSPDGAIWDSTTIDSAGVVVNGENKFALYFDIAFVLYTASCDGVGSDTVAVLGAGNPTRTTRQLPVGYNDTAVAITVWFHNTSAAGKTLCIDTSFFQPGGTWKWVRIEGPTEYTFYPEFLGSPGQSYIGGSGYCYQIQPIQPQNQGEIVIAGVSNRIYDSMVVAGLPVRWLLRYNNNTGQKLMGILNSFRVTSPDGARWDSTTIDTVGWQGTGQSPFAHYFDLVFALQKRSNDGADADSVMAGGAAMQSGLPAGYNDSSIAITAWFHDTLSVWKHICLDTVTVFPPAGRWEWVGTTTTRYYPSFGGMPNYLYRPGYGYCLQLIPGQAPTGQGIVSIDHVSSSAGGYKVAAGRPMRMLLRYQNNTLEKMDISNGFKLSSPDGATWDSTTIDTIGYQGSGKSPFTAYFDIAFGLLKYSNDGMGEDSVGFIAAGRGSQALKQMPAGYNDTAIAITAWSPDSSSVGRHICIDTSFLRPALTWVWVSQSLREYYPAFVGLPGQLRSPGNLGTRLGSGYCFEIVDVPISQCQAIRVPADYSTIQAAINAAHDCDTIFVSSGVYNENITFGGKQLIIRSVSSRDSTIIMGTGANAAVVTMDSGEPKGTEINGFTITGGKKGGVYCSGSSPTVRFCIITGNVSSSIDDAAGINIVGTSGADIAYNRIYGNTAHTYGAAIGVGRTLTVNSDDTIRYNVMYDNTGLGDVRILGTLHGLMIFNNTIEVTTYDGIALQGTGVVQVRNNIVTSAPVWGIYKDNGEIVAEYNCLYGNGSAFGGGVSPGAGNIYTDPKFVNAAVGNFYLLATSPCINTGDPSPIYNDMDSSRNDIGAHFFWGPPVDDIIQLKQWTRSMGGNDHWYGILPQSIFWVDANVAAQRPLPQASGNGYLATVTTALENFFIRDSILAGTHQTSILDQFWLGGRDIQGQWTWITGEPFVYTNWGTGEPNNVGIETALGMWGPSAAEPGKFNNSLPDSSIHSLHRFWSVIEWDPVSYDSIPDTVLPEVFPTNEWILVYCAVPKLDRGLVPPGSIIVATDPAGVVCGAMRTMFDGSFGMMPIYRDDPYTRVDEGCQPGDIISFTINKKPVFAQPPVYWTRNGDQFEVCQFLTQKCQEIQLRAGWNLISWNVAHSGDIDSLIAPIRDQVDLVLAFDRGALAYDPDLVPFSTLHHVDYSHGYWFKMKGDAVLRVCGGYIDQFEYIPVYQGWNLVGYWPSEVWTVQNALMTVMANLQVAIGFDNGIKVYVPGQDPYNTLTTMRPGLGYWIRSLMPDVLDYFFLPTSGGNETNVPVAATGGDATASRDWMSLYGKDITLDGQLLEENTSIEVFTLGGIKVGQSTYSNGLLKFMPVYGYDAQDPNAALYPKDGDVVALFVSGVKTEQAIEWHGSGTTLELGSLTSAVQLPGQYSLSQNFPNPFNPNTTISFELPRAGQVSLTIYNMLGQRIRTLTERAYDAGQHRVEWDGRSDGGDAVSSGIYLYRIASGSFAASKKMLLLK